MAQNLPMEIMEPEEMIDSELVFIVPPERTQEEYEMQHFGFTAKGFVECVCQNAERHASTILQEFENQYISQNGSSSEFAKFMQNYKEACQPSLDTFRENIKSYAQKYFVIPSNILLPGDEDQEKQITDAEHEKLDKEIEMLEEQIKNENVEQSELERNEHLLQKLLDKSEKKLEQIEKEVDVLNETLDHTDSEELDYILVQIKQYLNTKI
ncbi:uncharacterized protein LOC113383561 [Ctenocephalides felis]|uniref:uncharacterized protein LOC113383561 n=1 Tax=Ctenocephalides felis TaxID=7515 RepID=UPI000E6E3DD0|nr:uncharacterized protein LOC113383561 [Ctenocephalides felis]